MTTWGDWFVGELGAGSWRSSPPCPWFCCWCGNSGCVRETFCWLYLLGVLDARVDCCWLFVSLVVPDRRMRGVCTVHHIFKKIFNSFEGKKPLRLSIGKKLLGLTDFLSLIVNLNHTNFKDVCHTCWWKRRGRNSGRSWQVMAGHRKSWKTVGCYTSSRFRMWNCNHGSSHHLLIISKINMSFTTKWRMPHSLI